LELVGDTLYASGPVTYDWAFDAQPLVAMVPGVASLDFSRADLTVPAELAYLERLIEERRILFDVGSAALVGTAPRLLDETAALLDSLLEAVRETGYEVSLELLGRTDTTGTMETNRVLGRRRANRVREALIDRGVPTAVVTATGIGTSDPIHAEDRETFQALNRSVSYAVAVTFGVRGGGSEE
jgi:OOP family OmpA-OmpF porin